MAGRIGQRLGNYRIVRLLGQGGFAHVYLGEHVHLGTEAAIKVLSSSLEDQDITMFRTEAQIIARLKHPNIVHILDFGLEKTVPFLVMEYAAGGTLRQLHPEGTRLPLPVALIYTQQIANALGYLHQQKLVHCDIKPQNILLDAQKTLLVSDFGFATFAQSSVALHGRKLLAGTMAYMAPEQIRGEPEPASDQYALGIMVYEWLTGRRPFRGTHMEVASQQLLTPPPSPRKFNAELSSTAELVLLRALAKRPSERFATMQDFASALERAISVTPQRTAPVTPTPYNVLPVSSSAQRRVQREPVDQPRVAVPVLAQDTPDLITVVHQVPDQQTLPLTIHDQQALRFISRLRWWQCADVNSSIRTHRGLAAGSLLSVLVLVPLLAALVYFLPRASIVITVQARPFVQPVQLAIMPHPPGGQPGDVQAQLLQQHFLVSGSSMPPGPPPNSSGPGGQPTGGPGGPGGPPGPPAQGTITLTNNGNTTLTVPAGTFVQTQNAIEFATDAEVVVRPGQALSISVTATNPGSQGDVSANTITSIPLASLQGIAQRTGIDPTLIDAHILTVNNPGITQQMGGPPGGPPMDAGQDQVMLTQMLHKSLQHEIETWLESQMHIGDFMGPSVPAVVESVQPLPDEQFSVLSGTNQNNGAGTLSGSLAVTVSVLVARAAALRAAASVQLGLAASHLPRKAQLAQLVPVSLQNMQRLPVTEDDGVVRLSGTASGAIIPWLDKQELSRDLAARGIGQVRQQLQTSFTARTVQITVFPSFLPILPLQVGRISLSIQTLPPSA